MNHFLNQVFLSANPMKHFLDSSFFGNEAIILVFGAFD